MAEEQSGLLNVYDRKGDLVGTRSRADAMSEGLTVGVVYVLLVNGNGEVLLQRRPKGIDNGERWDKTVGGHVDAGEDFDRTAAREAGEELFDDADAARVLLLPDENALRRHLADEVPVHGVVFAPVGRHLNVRDVRHAPEGDLRNVLFHVAVYLGRTDLPVDAFRPQPDEVAGLAYFPAGEVDALLARGELAPNMTLLWLAHARRLLDLV